MQTLSSLASSDPAMSRALDLCKKAVSTDLPILILGETGTGKDCVARALHASSPRRAGPFSALNCAAIPAPLLASELFGYAPGTFTGGAKGGRVGKIAASNGGTLFLDEIGDMPFDMQAHLLRVLEERRVTPLGAIHGVPVDMKIICATHHNLADLVSKTAFRKDLYYRIKGIEVRLPRLSERTDLAEIVRKLAEQELGSGISGFALSPEALAAFRRHSWPGNVRELKSVIRFITSMHGATRITLEHLPEDFADCASPKQSVAVTKEIEPHTPVFRGDRPIMGGSPTLIEANQAGEKRYIVDALRACKWNITDASVRLGVSRATLHRRIRKYRIISPNHLA